MTSISNVSTHNQTRECDASPNQEISILIQNIDWPAFCMRLQIIILRLVITEEVSASVKLSNFKCKTNAWHENYTIYIG